MRSEAAVILALGVVLAIGMLAAFSRHKKSGPGSLMLVGSIGVVEKSFDPDGTVIIEGELWRACLTEGVGLARGARVHVVGTCDHLLLVKPHA